MMKTVNQSNDINYNIQVEVQTEFLEHQSEPDENYFVFSYVITLHNRGNIPAKLIARHWIITDGNGVKKEVHGKGVVGAHPHLQPGESYSYSSGAIIQTPVGSMQGTYHMQADDGTRFESIIEPFRLAINELVH